MRLEEKPLTRVLWCHTVAEMWEKLVSIYEHKSQVSTWNKVPWPNDKKVIESKWVFKIKNDDKCIARLVARGFQYYYLTNKAHCIDY